MIIHDKFGDEFTDFVELTPEDLNLFDPDFSLFLPPLGPFASETPSTRKIG